MKPEKWYKLAYWLLRPVCALLYPIRVSGRHLLPEGAVILCANHSNAVDPILISIALGSKTYVHHLAKAELRKIPVVGAVLEKIGAVFVRRGERDIDSYKSCLRILKGGERLIAFPEGTRVHGTDEVGAKSGVIHMAARTGAYILPIRLERDKKLFRRTDVVFGEPYRIEVGGHGDYDTLAQELMDRITGLDGE